MQLKYSGGCHEASTAQCIMPVSFDLRGLTSFECCRPRSASVLMASSTQRVFEFGVAYQAIGAHAFQERSPLFALGSGARPEQSFLIEDQRRAAGQNAQAIRCLINAIELLRQKPVQKKQSSKTPMAILRTTKDPENFTRNSKQAAGTLCCCQEGSFLVCFCPAYDSLDDSDLSKCNSNSEYCQDAGAVRAQEPPESPGSMPCPCRSTPCLRR